jgi:hypothetical protein
MAGNRSCSTRPSLTLGGAAFASGFDSCAAARREACGFNPAIVGFAVGGGLAALIDAVFLARQPGNKSTRPVEPSARIAPGVGLGPRQQSLLLTGTF